MKLYQHPAHHHPVRFQEGVSHTFMIKDVVPSRLIESGDFVYDHMVLHIQPGHSFWYHRHNYAFDILTLVQRHKKGTGY